MADVNPEGDFIPPEQDVLVRDFYPRATLALQEHTPQKPCYPVINVHTHLSLKLKKSEKENQRFLDGVKRVLGGDNPTSRDFLRTLSKGNDTIEDVIKTMDDCNVEKCVDLDGLFSPAEHFKLYKSFKDRIILFKILSLDGFDDPEYSQREASQLQQAVDAGARGLKVHKVLGLTARDGSGKVIAVDHPKLDPVWAKAGQLGVPVLMHVADPACFFMPVDRYNPAYKKLSGHPERSYYGPEFPSKEEILTQRDNVIAGHHNTIFIAAHHGNCPENLDYVGSTLDKYPNLYVELSYALVQLGLQPHHARKHFIKYQDRILFGTDGIPDAARYRMYYRFLETDDDYFRCGNGGWEDYISCLNVPKSALEKIYYKNAKRIIPLD